VTNQTISEQKDSSSNTTDKKENPVIPFHGRGDLFCTGQLGAVMKESSAIAYTVAKRHLSIIKPDSHFFQKHRIHLHLPSGAIPKDGPSAGITMVCSLLSLALHTPMKQGLAMTGELTLTGKVLPIGGVKDKLMAAKHAQITTILLPVDNMKDVVELPDFIKKDLEIIYVSHYSDVFAHAFPQFKESQENALNKLAALNRHPYPVILPSATASTTPSISHHI
jgi:ATP-dependent Lon protease